MSKMRKDVINDTSTDQLLYKTRISSAAEEDLNMRALLNSLAKTMK